MFKIDLFCGTGSSPPLVLDGQDLKLVSVKLNGKALKVYIDNSWTLLMDMMTF